MMKRYKVEVKETLARIIEVEADCESDAVEKVRGLYRNEEIILDSGDYVDTDINVFGN